MRTTLVGLLIWILTVFSGATIAKAPPSGTEVACSVSVNDCHQDWTGSRTSTGRIQSVLLHVAPTGKKATVDFPDFGALDIPVSKFAFIAGRIHFELIGDSSTAVFDGNARGDAMHGTWSEGERAGGFELRRVHAKSTAFREVNVSFQNGDVRLAGTLLLPGRKKASPVIVFVQGAGPETRSASRFLAEFFVKRGVAALIYDKRGAGSSSGDWKHSSFEDLAVDVTAAVTFLKGRSDIDAARIGLMGSSQGGWIAPMAAVRMPGVAFVIVKSAAAVTPEQQELARVERQMRAEGAAPADISQALALYKRAIAYAQSGEGWEALSHEIEADSKEKWTLFPRGTPKDYWFFDQVRLTFRHDPIAVLQQLQAPLLVIFGGQDDDGPPLQDQLGPLLDAMHAGGKQSILKVFPSAGHDLRVEPGNGQEWDFPRFAPGYLDSLAMWAELQGKVMNRPSAGSPYHHRQIGTDSHRR